MQRSLLRIMAGVAVVALGTVGCQTTPTQQGALMGGTLGAATGAIIGHQSGKQGEGALIGAGAGALAGALLGDQYDDRVGRPYANQPRVQAAPARGAGHWETRVVTAPSGERYEERVWVPAR